MPAWPARTDQALMIEDIDRTPDHRHATGHEDTEVVVGPRPAVVGHIAGDRLRASIAAALFGGDQAPAQIGRYRLLDRLGEGGMGVVYRAHDDRLDREVAIKVLRGDRHEGLEARARTLAEARTLARLSHPNIVAVHEVGEHEGQIFVVMELLRGPTLRAWLDAERRPWPEVVAAMQQAAAGLAAAHRASIVHRDFKPHNAIFGDDGRLRVVDFGLARAAAAGGDGPPEGRMTAASDPAWTMSGALVGTPAYMAPEQFRGERVDPRCDQFAFCVTLYEALHGRRPFVGRDVKALMEAIVEGKIAPRPAGDPVPAWLDAIVARGLARRPEDRWPSMEALSAALAADPARRRRRALGLAGLGLGAATLAAGMTWLALPDREEEVHAAQEEVTSVRAEARSQADDAHLREARHLLDVDPWGSLRELAKIDGEDPSTWRAARTLALVAEARGLPSAVLTGGWGTIAEIVALADRRLLVRDQRGALWLVDPEVGARRSLADGQALAVAAAADAPVWAIIEAGRARVFRGDDAAVTHTLDLTDLGVDAAALEWRLSPAGDALIALATRQTFLGAAPYFTWDLAQAAPPARPAAGFDALAVPPTISPDGATILVRERGRTSVVDRVSGRVAAMSGAGTAATADGRALIHRRAGEDQGSLVATTLADGSARPIDGEVAHPLVGDEILTSARGKRGIILRRIAATTGEVRWSRHVAHTTEHPAPGDGLAIDVRADRLAVFDGDRGVWLLMDLSSGTDVGALVSGRDEPPRWLDGGALAYARGAELRLWSASAGSLTGVHQGGLCRLSPASAYALSGPHGPDADPEGAIHRIDLRSEEVTRVPCPRPPATSIRPGAPARYVLHGAIDDAGRALLSGRDGYTCLGDGRGGARPLAEIAGSVAIEPRRGSPGFVALGERGLRVVDGGGVAGPEVTFDGQPRLLAQAPDGRRLAVAVLEGATKAADVLSFNLKSASVQVVDLERAAATRLPITLDGAAMVVSFGAWEGDELVIGRERGGGVDLSRWRVDAAVVEQRLDEAASARPLALRPGGAARLLGDRRASTLVDPWSGATRPLGGPVEVAAVIDGDRLLGLHDGQALMIDVAAAEPIPLVRQRPSGQVSPSDLGRAADGTTWLCHAQRPGSLSRWRSALPEDPAALAEHLRALLAERERGA